MNDLEIKELAKKPSFHTSDWYKHVYDLYEVREHIPQYKTRFIFKTYCPKCDTRIYANKELRDRQSFMDYYKCPNCDYEYAEHS